MNNLVSIILPTYNGSRFISQSIESCLSQSYRNIELIVVDDASTDNVSDIVNEYARKDSRVNYVKHEKNMKLPNALNTGFAKSMGEYLTWTSDDNIYKHNAIEVMVDYLTSNIDTAFVFADMERIDGFGNYVSYQPCGPVEDLPIMNTVCACFMYRRDIYDALGDYDINKFLVEDWDYWVRAHISHELRHIPRSLYYYREHNNSLTGMHYREQQLASLSFVMENNLRYGDVLSEDIKLRSYKLAAARAKKIGNFELENECCRKIFEISSVSNIPNKPKAYDVLVSVIIPVYNVEQYLHQCLHSVVNQTYKYLEIIIVNDGSTDSSGIICDEFKIKDSRVKVFHQNNNGLSEARNTGLRIAEGKYIYFLDSDDWIREDTIELLVGCAEIKKCDVVILDGMMVSDTGKTLVEDKRNIRSHQYPVLSGVESFCLLLRDEEYSFAAYLSFVSKELVLANNIRFQPNIIHEDCLYTYWLFANATSIAHVNEPLYRRRIRSNSITGLPVSLKNVQGHYITVLNIKKYWSKIEKPFFYYATTEHLCFLLNKCFKDLIKLDAHDNVVIDMFDNIHNLVLDLGRDYLNHVFSTDNTATKEICTLFIRHLSTFGYFISSSYTVMDKITDVENLVLIVGNKFLQQNIWTKLDNFANEHLCQFLHCCFELMNDLGYATVKILECMSQVLETRIVRGFCKIDDIHDPAYKRYCVHWTNLFVSFTLFTIKDEQLYELFSSILKLGEELGLISSDALPNIDCSDYVIWHGAGARCEFILKHAFLSLPDEIWDKRACDEQFTVGSDYCVNQPEFVSLQNKDKYLIVVCIDSMEGYNEVKHQYAAFGLYNVCNWRNFYASYMLRSLQQ